MEGKRDVVLGHFQFYVAGTRHLGRQATIRKLVRGDSLILWQITDHPKDPDAIAVTLEDQETQVGWVPAVFSRAVSNLKLEKAEVLSTGTDEEGAWTKLKIRVYYNTKESGSFGKKVQDHGIRVAAVLGRMSFPRLRIARQIAKLPLKEQDAAILEYDMSQETETVARRERRKK